MGDVADDMMDEAMDWADRAEICPVCKTFWVPDEHGCPVCEDAGEQGYSDEDEDSEERNESR